MATEISARPQGWPQPNGKGHEERDVHVKWIFVFVFCFFGAVLGMHFGVRWHVRSLEKQAQPTDPWTDARRAARGKVSPLPGTPMLQLSATADLESFRASEEAELNSYGWVNRTGGIVRIPIERAMELILKPGVLPVRQGSNAPAAGPSTLQLQQQRPMQQ
jgi:hypothetical protein